MHAAGEALYCRVAPNHTPSGPARQFMHLSVAEIAKECLRRNGVSTQGLHGEALITRAMGGLLTTSDLPLILGDTVSRTLVEGYKAAPAVLKSLGKQVSVPDFRTRQRVQLDFSGIGLERLNEHAEIRNAAPLETFEQYSIATYARMIGVTRNLLINDDLAALTDMARHLGQACTAFESQFLADLLTTNSGAGPNMASDGLSFFCEQHHNVIEGGPPSEETLIMSAARLAMRLQTSISGALIDVVPAYILVPPQLETTTQKLLASIQPTRSDDVNVFAGTLKLLVEPRLAAKSATRWYLIADPATFEGLQYSYLSGREGPRLDSQPGWRVLGVEWRVFEDWGTGLVEPRGRVMCQGDAS